MAETPIRTQGTIVSQLSELIFRTSLPNGKIIIGHVPKRLSDLSKKLKENDVVTLEMTPYDFDKARIVSIITPLS